MLRNLFRNALAFGAIILPLYLLMGVCTAARAQVVNPPDTYSREDVNALAAQQLAEMKATIPLVIKSTNVLADTNGSFTVTWSAPFVSATPTASAKAVINTPLPTECQITDVTATTVSGYCAQAGNTQLGATIASVLGVTIQPFPARVPAGTRIMVIAREPTQ